MVRLLGGERVRDEWMVCGGLLAIRRNSSMFESVREFIDYKARMITDRDPLRRLLVN